MSVFVSYFSLKQGLYSSLAARYLPFLGYKAKQPQSAAAVYLPAWIVDAQLEANMWFFKQSENVYQQVDLSGGQRANPSHGSTAAGRCAFQKRVCR